VLQVLERARRAVAAAGGRRRKWQPRAMLRQRRGSVARAGEGQRRGARAAGKLGGDAWGLPEAGGGAGRAAAAVSSNGLLRGSRGAEEEEGGGAPGAVV
jgi:hypothetical protein